MCLALDGAVYIELCDMLSPRAPVFTSTPEDSLVRAMPQVITENVHCPEIGAGPR